MLKNTVTIVKEIREQVGEEGKKSQSLVFADMEQGGYIVEPLTDFVTLGCKFTKHTDDLGTRTAGAFIHVPKSHLPEMVATLQAFIKENNIV